jgi:hypothetical protein
MGDDWKRGDGSTLRGERPMMLELYQEPVFDASSTKPEFSGLGEPWQRTGKNQPVSD